MPETLEQVPESLGDMPDTREEMAFWAPLPLQECAPMATEFDVADRDALANQKFHRSLTISTALCAGVTVLSANWILGFGHIYTWLEKRLSWVEILPSLVGAAAVIVGMKRGWKDRWLINRYKAELYRLAKFDLLVHPAVWLAGDGASEKWVRDKMEEIHDVKDKKALREATIAAILSDEPTDLPQIQAPTLLKLVEYYLAKRLNPQKEYLANRAQRNEFWNGWLQRNINTGLLFMSVAAAVLQFMIISLLHPVGVGSVIVATLGGATLPVLAVTIRTLRQAFEFSRNRTRFWAAHNALAELERRLTHQLLAIGVTAPTPHAAAVILRELGQCEAELRRETQEWLRLMLESE
jgi:hypothetical protein